MAQWMKNIVTIMIVGFLVIGSSLMIAGCDGDSDTDEAVQQTGEAAEDAASEASDIAEKAAEEAGNVLEDAADRLGD